MQLDHRQKAAVIAALRFWQRTDSATSEPENDIATNGDEFDALQTAEIDALIEEINFDSPDVEPVGASLAGALIPAAMGATKALQERVADLESSHVNLLNRWSALAGVANNRIAKLEERVAELNEWQVEVQQKR